MQHTIKFIDNSDNGSTLLLKFIGDNENSSCFPDSNYQEVDADGTTHENYFTTEYVCECVRDGDWTPVAFILTADNGTSFTVGDDEPSTEQEDEEELKIVRGKNLRIQLGYYSGGIEVFTYDADEDVWLCEQEISWSEKEIQEALDEGSWALLEVIEPSVDDKKDNLPRVDLLIDLGYENRKEVFTYDAEDDSWVCEDEMTWKESVLREEFENGCWSLIGPAPGNVRVTMPDCVNGSTVIITHHNPNVGDMVLTRSTDGWSAGRHLTTYWSDEQVQRFLDEGVWLRPRFVEEAVDEEKKSKVPDVPVGSIVRIEFDYEGSGETQENIRFTNGWGSEYETEEDFAWTDEQAQKFFESGRWSNPVVVREGPEVEHEERWFMSPDGVAVVLFSKFSNHVNWTFSYTDLKTGATAFYPEILESVIGAYVSNNWQELPRTITLHGQWQADGTVEAFRVKLKDGDAMFIQTNEDGGVYVTRDEAKAFFGL